jgi:hypothetical protein
MMLEMNHSGGTRLLEAISEAAPSRQLEDSSTPIQQITQVHMTHAP